MHTHTAFLSSSISAPLLLLRLSLALPHLLPSAHPHRRVRSAARLPPPRRPPCRASPHSRLVGPRLAPPHPFAFPASTPTLPRLPFPDPFASPLLHLSPAVFSATVTLFLPWPRVFRATSLSPPLPPLFLADPYARSFFFFSPFFLPCLSSAFLRLFFHLFSLRVSYRFSPIFHSLRPTLLYTFTDPVSIRPSSSRFRSLRFASLSLFLSFFPSSFLFYVYVRIYFIYMYIHIYV